MKIFKRFMSVLMGILCALIMVMSVSAEEVEPEIIFRKEYSYTGKHIRGSGYNLIYNVIAKSNGEINVPIYCTSSYNDGWGQVGYIQFNKNEIAELEMNGCYGRSFVKTFSFSPFITSRVDNDMIIYTLTCGEGHGTSGNYILDFTFYVKEPYLNSPVTMSVLDQEITIPFGDKIPSTEQSEMIHELESQINVLNSEIERLKSELEVAHQNEANLIEDIDYLYADIDTLMARRGDINDDGQYTVADVVLLARYVAGTIDTIPYVPGGD